MICATFRPDQAAGGSPPPGSTHTILDVAQTGVKALDDCLGQGVLGRAVGAAPPLRGLQTHFERHKLDPLRLLKADLQSA